MAIRPREQAVIDRLHNVDLSRYAPKPKPERKAGEKIPKGLDALIDEIREEAAEERLELALQSARVYLNRQYGIEDQFMAAGLSPTQARMVQALEELEGRGVPSAAIAPIQGGGELRVHTKYGTNPLTGQQEILPFEVNGAPLVTHLGRNVPMNGHEKATEYIQEQAMLLAGLPVTRGNVTDKYAADFRVGNQVVDGEIRFDTEGQNIPIQLYTDVAPSDSRGMSQYQVRDTVKKLIDKEMKKGKDVIDAVEDLSRQRVLSNHRGNRPPTQGQVLYGGDKRIDQLIMPTLTKAEAEANKRARDTIAIAPQEIRMVNLDAVNDAISEMDAAQIQQNMQVRANMGNNLDGARGRVYVRVNQNAPGVSYDLADRYPHAAQLYA